MSCLCNIYVEHSIRGPSIQPQGSIQPATRILPKVRSVSRGNGETCLVRISVLRRVVAEASSLHRVSSRPTFRRSDTARRSQHQQSQQQQQQRRQRQQSRLQRRGITVTSVADSALRSATSYRTTSSSFTSTGRPLRRGEGPSRGGEGPSRGSQGRR